MAGFFDNTKIQVKIQRSCLNQNKTLFHHEKAVNLYIVYELNLRSHGLGTNFNFFVFLLNEICFFLTVKLTKIC